MLRRTAAEPRARAMPPRRRRRRTSRRPTRTARSRPGRCTRNGAARRAVPLGAEHPQRQQHGDRGRWPRRRVTTRPAASPPPSPTRSRATKKISAPGGWPATCTGQLAGAQSTGIRVTYSRSIAGRSVDRARGLEVLVRGGRGSSPTPLEPVDQREREHPRQPADVRRQPAGDARTAGARERRRRTVQASTASTTAGTRAPARRAGPSRRAAAGTDPHVHVPVR